MRTRQLTASLAVTTLAGSLLGAAPADATRDRAPDDAARVVARIDVTGNGKDDVVRFKKNGEHTMVVRVKTDRGRVDRKVVHARWITSGGWYGAARLDGHRGRELALLTDAGAHSLYYTTLTWRRKAGLKVEPAPSGGRWGTDGAALGGAGWLRRTGHHDGHRTVSMTFRYLYRSSSKPVWHGKATRYVWRHGDWHKRGTHKLRVHGDRSAQRQFGWRNTDLRPFPR